MLFNSIEFLIFLPIVFCLYWFVFNKNLKLQNLLILISSYVFYGWWDWRFLSLIFLSTVVDYFVGIQIFNNKKTKQKKRFLWFSVVFNLGLLGFFKYFNFFIESWVDLLSSIGYDYQNVWSLNIILPVGISFYTFQTMSYSLDIYYNKLKPTRDFISFASFVSFFPQLVAGPIERASNFLPQILKKRKFNLIELKYGCYQIIWGFFKKMVIADNCAYYVNIIYNNYQDYTGSTLLLATILFSFQIYGDFSGYSDIAIGVSRTLGIKLKLNFSLPYFSRDIAEFWRRWHISLSSWFRDYLYIPLGGSMGHFLKKIRNVFIIFLVSGFWHGANWTFLMWGFINAIYFLPLLILNRNRSNLDLVGKKTVLLNFIDFLKIIVTFSLVSLAWIFFRSHSLNQAYIILSQIFSSSIFESIQVEYGLLLFFIAFQIVIEWINRSKDSVFNYSIDESHNKEIVNNFLLMIVVWLIIIFSKTDNIEFIYFQF